MPNKVKQALIDALKEAKSGDYYVAVANRRKFRGTLDSYAEGEIFLENHQDVGEEDDCGTSTLVLRFGLIEDEIAESKLTQFRVVTDKRLIKIIQNDKLPEVGGEPVRKVGRIYRFGCGAVELTRVQIKNVIKMHKIMNSDAAEQYKDTVDLANSNGVTVNDEVIKQAKELLKHT